MASAWGKSWGNAWGVSWGLTPDAAHETVKSGVNRLWATMLQEESDKREVPPTSPVAVSVGGSQKEKEDSTSAGEGANQTSKQKPQRVSEQLEHTRPTTKLRPFFGRPTQAEVFISEENWRIIAGGGADVRLLQKFFEMRAEEKLRNQEDESLLLLLAA